MAEPESPESKAEPAAKSEQPSSLLQHAGLALGIVVVANVLFYFLSERYFTERAAKHGPHELLGLDPARLGFAIFALVVAAAAVAASAAPRHVGHGIGYLAGAVSVVASFAVLQTELSAVLAVTLLGVAIVFPVLARASWQGSRAAWAFLVSMCGTLGIVTMFGAPKLKTLLGIGLWNAMILPGVLGVGCAALAVLHRDYRESARE